MEGEDAQSGEEGVREEEGGEGGWGQTVRRGMDERPAFTEYGEGFFVLGFSLR